MERLNLSASTIVTESLKGGTTITARKIEAPRVIPGSVAEHEAAHVVAAGEIVSATIIPKGDALGTTQPVKMTAATAAAAEALGHTGTGWDMFLTEHVLGVDPGTAKAAARSALSGKDEELLEVATLLEERKTISQRDVEEARKNIIKRRQGIFEVEIEIRMPGEKMQSLSGETFHGEIKISDLIPYSKAA